MKSRKPAGIFAMGRSASHGNGRSRRRRKATVMSATQSWARMLNNMGFTPDPAKAPLATIGVSGGRIRNATASESRAGRLAGGPAQAQVARSLAPRLKPWVRCSVHELSLRTLVVLARGPRTNPTFDGAIRELSCSQFCDASVSRRNSCPRPGYPTRQFWHHANGRVSR